MWLRAAGVEGVDASRGPRFDHPGLVLDAAAAGGGVALALSTIVAVGMAACRHDLGRQRQPEPDHGR